MIPYSMDYMRRQLRVCIYARVSTEHEAQISALENQLDWYIPAILVITANKQGSTTNAST